MESVQFSGSLLLPDIYAKLSCERFFPATACGSLWQTPPQPFCWQLLSGLWISNAGRLLMGFWSTYFSESNFFWHTFQFCKCSLALYLSVWFQIPHKPLKAYRSTYSWKENFTCQKYMLSFVLPFFTSTLYFHCASVKAVLFRTHVLAPYLLGY